MPMSELKQRLLKRELTKIGFPEATYIPESDSIKVHPGNDRSPDINDGGGVRYWKEDYNLAMDTLRPMAVRVNEVVDAWEKSREIHFDGVSNFRILAEYNNIVLAARSDCEYGRGLHFTTWQYNLDRTGFDHGHYTEDYAAAKEDFAVRAGLMPSEKVFEREQAAEIIKSIKYRIDNDGSLTYGAETELARISDRITAGYALTTEPEEVAIRHEPQITQISATKAINGELHSGDWVITATDGTYGYLVGQVTEIVPLGSPEHDTGNPADDVHINFADMDYSDERKAEIIDQISGFTGAVDPLEMHDLGDIIMSPDELIRISGPEISDMEYAVFEEILDSRDATKAYCNQVTSALSNDKHTQLMERLDANFESYQDLLRVVDTDDLAQMAGGIVARTDTYHYMTELHDYDSDELDFYLQFQNPLEIVADEWYRRMEDTSDLCFAMGHVFRTRDALQGAYPLMTDAPEQTDLGGIRNEEDICDNPVKDDKPAELAAKKQKRSLDSRLQEASEKVKAQCIKNDTKDKSRNAREERD